MPQRKIDAETAKRPASRFIPENLPDRFCAGAPRFLQFPLRTLWAVPVLLSYPRLGPVGQTGILAVDTETGAVVGRTPMDEINEIGKTIYFKKGRDRDRLFSRKKRLIRARACLRAALQSYGYVVPHADQRLVMCACHAYGVLICMMAHV